MADEPVPSAELFLDERGSLLRARWDADEQRLLFSIWREGTCVVTQSLDFADTARLSGLLTQAWIDGLRRSLNNLA